MRLANHAGWNHLVQNGSQALDNFGISVDDRNPQRASRLLAGMHGVQQPGQFGTESLRYVEAKPEAVHCHRDVLDLRLRSTEDGQDGIAEATDRFVVESSQRLHTHEQDLSRGNHGLRRELERLAGRWQSSVDK